MNASHVADEVRDAVVRLRAENQRQMDVVAASRLVSLLRAEGALEQEAKLRLLGYLQIQSDGFQRMLRVRLETESDEHLRGVAREHLEEESGHNTILSEARGTMPALWDPTVAACSAWFVDSMRTLSPMGRVVLVHLVVEGGALAVLSAARSAFGGHRYFRIHAEEDEGHMEMGYEILASRPDLDVDEALTVLDQGWQVGHLMVERLAALAAR